MKKAAKIFFYLTTIIITIIFGFLAMTLATLIEIDRHHVVHTH